MDSEFMITDLFDAIRPKLKLFETYEQAAEAVSTMFAQIARQPAADEVDEANDDERLNASVEAALDEEEAAVEDEDEEEDSDETSEDDLEGSEAADFESDVEVAPRGSALSQAEEDEFALELAKLMSDGPTERGPTKAPAARLDIGIPRSNQPVVAKDRNHMAFTLLGKRGKAKTVDVPIESDLAKGSVARREEARAEQQQLKKLVLAYERREDSDRRTQWQDDAARRGIKIQFKG